MTTSPLPTETIECPLCSGAGKLKRTEILDRLGMRDVARVAQLSAEEAFRLLQRSTITITRADGLVSRRNSRSEPPRSGSTTRTNCARAQSERDDLTRRVEDCSERSRPASGTRTTNWRPRWRRSPASASARRWTSPKRRGLGRASSSARSFPKNGDFILAYRDPSGAPLEPRIVVDNKDKAIVSEGDIRKLIRDAKERRSPVGVIVAREESQLRQLDRERRWGQEDGVWVLRTTRHWLPRDLEVLKPVFERMRTEGAELSPEEFRAGGGSPPHVRRSGRGREGAKEGGEGYRRSVGADGEVQSTVADALRRRCAR